MTESTDKSKVPAYVSYATLKNFIEGFSETGLPAHVDKSLMPTMSGAVQNHLMASLKFLQLISDDGTTSQAFNELVEAHGTDKYKEVLRKQVDAAYEGIADSSPISRLTPKKLQEGFREAGATGSTLGRAIRFYITALKDCDVEVPKHLAKTSGTAQARKSNESDRPRKTVKKRKPPAKASEANPSELNGDLTPKDMIDFQIPLGHTDGLIRVPRNIRSDQMPVFNAIVSAVEALANQNSSEAK